jgi:hypothetical protein
VSDPTPRDPVAHRKLSVVETADEGTLDRLFADPELRPFLWLRLGPRRALLDPLASEPVRRRLAALALAMRYASELSD